MTKSLAACVVCVLPLLAACGEENSTCVELGSDVLVEVTADSAKDNVGDCRVPPAFRLGVLGCNISVKYSSDICVAQYQLLCIKDVQIDMNVTQTTGDGIVGTLHKTDGINGCGLDLEIVVKNTPAP
jgi:hypothetical protein